MRIPWILVGFFVAVVGVPAAAQSEPQDQGLAVPAAEQVEGLSLDGPSDASDSSLASPSTTDAAPTPFYNLLSAPEEPEAGGLVRVYSSAPDIQLMIYGRISLDTVTSTGRLLAPYGYIFLAPDTPEGQWTNVISARQSTLGFLFQGPPLVNFDTLARFETYFLDNLVDANVYGLAQYFLYAKLINDDWAFTGGVTSALVNPQAPSVLNASSGSDFGNLGFLRPQLRAERFLRVSDRLRITPQFALTSPVGTDFFQTPTAGPDGLALGEENGWPNVESRLAVGWGTKAEGDRYFPVEFGLSGAIGELRFSRSDLVGPAERFTTRVWMCGADLRWQLAPRWVVKAEGFYGNALGSYAAGIKQTFNTVTGNGVRAMGGFLELEFKPGPRWASHVGYMIDDPLDRDVAVDGRTRQQNVYGNIVFVYSRYLQIGCEVAHLTAGFQGLDRADNQAWVFHNKIIFTY